MLRRTLLTTALAATIGARIRQERLARESHATIFPDMMFSLAKERMEKSKL